MTEEQAAELDALNEATIRAHHRNILDRGIDGALHHAYQPGGGTLLEDLRANAGTVLGEPPARGKRAS